MSSVIQLSRVNADVLLAGPVPVLLGIGADWCQPCGPMKEEITRVADARRWADLRCAWLSIEDEPDLALRFDLKAVPTLIVVRDGCEIARVVGGLGGRALVGWLAEVGL